MTYCNFGDPIRPGAICLPSCARIKGNLVDHLLLHYPITLGVTDII